MTRKTQAKKTTRRALKKTAAPYETPIVAIATPSSISPIEGEKRVQRERRVLVQTTETPPVSPYVIDFRNQEREAPSLSIDEALTGISGSDEVNSRLLRFARNLRDRHVPDISRGLAMTKRSVTLARQVILAIGASLKTQTVARLQALTTVRHAKPRPRKRLNLRATKLHPTPYTIHPHSFRPALVFALIALLFVLPARGLEALGRVATTKDALQASGKAALAALSLRNFGQARLHFAAARAELDRAAGLATFLLPLIPPADRTYHSGKFLLDAGTHLTEAGRIMKDGLQNFGNAASPLASRFIHLEEAVRASFPLIRAAKIELDHVLSSALPETLRPEIERLRHALESIRSSFADLVALFPALETFLGLEIPQRYLVIFQNPNELRPTGGFVGSFALLDIDRGEISSIEIPGGGSYDLQGGLKARVIAPEPLHLIEPHWQFHDANWFPDFPTSARKLIWFYEKSGGPTVDGVIAINATVIPKILEIIGPIEMPEFDRTFTPENFIQETQKIVELEYDRTENRPKKLIGALAPKLIERLLTAAPDNALRVLETLGASLTSHDIQLYHRNEDVQAAYQRVGWTGELEETNGDYLAVVLANIAGGKTSGVIHTEIRHRATIALDGSIVDRLDITRTHNGKPGDIFTGVRNVEYLRVYVPLGSELVQASGFEAPPRELFSKPDAHYLPDADLAGLVKEVGRDPVSHTMISEEFRKLVFGNWVQLDPGETRTISLTYRLPWELTFASEAPLGWMRVLAGAPRLAAYTLLVEKQSGTLPTLDTEVIFPASLNVLWGRGGTLSGTTFRVHRSLETDVFTALLFEK